MRMLPLGIGLEFVSLNSRIYISVQNRTQNITIFNRNDKCSSRKTHLILPNNTTQSLCSPDLPRLTNLQNSDLLPQMAGLVVPSNNGNR